MRFNPGYYAYPYWNDERGGMPGDCRRSRYRNCGSHVGCIQERKQTNPGKVRLSHRIDLCRANDEFPHPGRHFRSSARRGACLRASWHSIWCAGDRSGSFGPMPALLRWRVIGSGSEYFEPVVARSGRWRIIKRPSQGRLAIILRPAWFCCMALGCFFCSQLLDRAGACGCSALLNLCSDDAGHPCSDRDRGSLHYGGRVLSLLCSDDGFPQDGSGTGCSSDFNCPDTQSVCLPVSGRLGMGG